MYYKHNLRVKLQEWRNRVLRANEAQFPTEISYFVKRLKSEPIFWGILEEPATRYGIDDKFAEDWLSSWSSKDYGEFVFSDLDKQAVCFYYILQHLINKHGADSIIYMSFLSGKLEERKVYYVETFITPIMHYLHDRLDESNSVLYLLEKYKRRVEWFTKKKLFKRYKDAIKSYEELLEDDLRLFLFDQGIDFPFSTPKSPSGRADIVGLIDTKDPLVAEIKIYDSEKGYKKNRVVSGFSQTIKYVNDYHKDSGYTIIYNLDNVELVFDFLEEQKTFPPRLTLHNKTYYFVVVNLFHGITASKQGKTKVVYITEQDLLDSLKD